MKTGEKTRKRNAPRQQPVAPCPICGRVRALVQDHSYRTGRCREYICGGCNTKLGFLEGITDDERARLLAYAQRWDVEHDAGRGDVYKKRPGNPGAVERARIRSREAMRRKRGTVWPRRGPWDSAT